MSPMLRSGVRRNHLWVDTETVYLAKLCAAFEGVTILALVRRLMREEARRCGIELEEEA